MATAATKTTKPRAPRKATGTRQGATATRRTRVKRPPAGPMPKEVRAAAAAALAVFEERLLDHGNVGFAGASTRELKAPRSGVSKAVRFEVDGAKHRAAVTITYR